MTRETLHQRELLLIDILHSGLDLRAKAAEIDSPVLVYLTELLAKRAREELGATAQSVEGPSVQPCEGSPAGAHPIN